MILLLVRKPVLLTRLSNFAIENDMFMYKSWLSGFDGWQELKRKHAIKTTLPRKQAPFARFIPHSFGVRAKYDKKDCFWHQLYSTSLWGLSCYLNNHFYVDDSSPTQALLSRPTFQPNSWLFHLDVQLTPLASNVLKMESLVCFPSTFLSLPW